MSMEKREIEGQNAKILKEFRDFEIEKKNFEKLKESFRMDQVLFFRLNKQFVFEFLEEQLKKLRTELGMANKKIVEFEGEFAEIQECCCSAEQKRIFLNENGRSCQPWHDKYDEILDRISRLEELWDGLAGLDIEKN